jgi:hypothetical protein
MGKSVKKILLIVSHKLGKCVISLIKSVLNFGNFYNTGSLAVAFLKNIKENSYDVDEQNDRRHIALFAQRVRMAFQ